ncbi:probable LRR receptor-like serine/threonine-protein kinase At4g36180 isoform X2 [Vigna radiata var. radiata]|uniref:Probable LRR receptor-like serine/threonine-protein kinase At4g36180 isoform X2 n=1 Tax=Vigna radiata var. radiata TaxID=3916 RepID=A0A1S3VY78_VIGRR|nr:probable LRR receptor-like serine/threonine-protein kinase At4g36180 isoform X2 [Vigna radiata var. radiata]
MELCGKKAWLVLMGAMVVLGHLLGTDGCFEEERNALLDFKASYGNESYVLASWLNDPKSNCCSWERVTCSSSSGHIIHLSLGNLHTKESGMEILGFPYGEMGPYISLRRPFCFQSMRSLNWSLFLPLRELRSLGLSNLCFLGFVPNQDDGKLTLKKLETLDLSFNSLNESIMELVGTLPSIKNLNLSGNSIRGRFMKELSRLPNLEVLDLSMNLIGNDTFLASQDYQSKSRLKKLGKLDLSFNYLNESIMEVVGALPSIKNLAMAGNFIGGPFPTKELTLLPNLETLDLSGNRLVSHIPNQDAHSVEFYVFKKLKALNLADNNFDKGIFKSLVAFPTLRSLDLGFNPIKRDLDDKVLSDLSKLEVLYLANAGINGILPNQGLCKMKLLQELDLSLNNLRGTLDACLDNLTSFRYLDVSFNYLSGNVTPFLAQLTSIKFLGIGFNNFEDIFSFNSFANHSNLKYLFIGNMKVETENPPWVASFQLEELRMSGCEINLPAEIPTFLSNQTSLIFLDLSRNNLVGNFPSWLLMNNPNLEALYLFDNSFTGPFELPFDKKHRMDQMIALSIRNNKLQGELPNNVGFFFPRLEFLDASNNKFDGPIPASIGEMSSLVELILDNNNFSGNVPEYILHRCFSLDMLTISNNQLNGTLLSTIRKRKLTFLAASRNNIEGAITDEWCQHEFLMLDISYNKFSGALPSCFKTPAYLLLQGNNFTGTIPELFMSNHYGAVAIDFSDNKFTGTIPDSVYKLWPLRFLLLAGNHLQGQISSQICQLKHINILDLSQNNFSGSIPACFSNMSFGNVTVPFYATDREKPFSPVPLVVMQLITKNLHLSFGSDRSQLLSELDLSCNQLTGEIPHQLGDLNGLRSLNLSHNHLNGLIPDSFQKLQNIESLDISNNNLSGQIPLQLQDLHSLAVFNVSYNNLSGRALEKGQFCTFDGSSYKGNPYLTWDTCKSESSKPPLQPTLLPDEVEEENSEIDFNVFCWSFATSYVMVIVALVTLLWFNPHCWRIWFYFVEVCLPKRI